MCTCLYIYIYSFSETVSRKLSFVNSLCFCTIKKKCFLIVHKNPRATYLLVSMRKMSNFMLSFFPQKSPTWQRSETHLMFGMDQIATAAASIDFKQLLCGLRQTLRPYSKLSSNRSPGPHCR